jgi:hypothetical protein
MAGRLVRVLVVNEDRYITECGNCGRNIQRGVHLRLDFEGADSSEEWCADCFAFKHGDKWLIAPPTDENGVLV